MSQDFSQNRALLFSGISTLRMFVEEVIDHVATRLTRHERGRYWLDEIYDPDELNETRPLCTSATTPGPETTVLLGYVKSLEHWSWVQKTRTYNIRTKGRPGGVDASAQLLFSQVLLLYCPDAGIVALARIVSEPELVNAAALKTIGYPTPQGDYWCVQLTWATSQHCAALFSADAIDLFVQGMGKLKGEPTAVRWAELAAMTAH